MKAALLVMGTVGLMAQSKTGAPPSPAAKPGEVSAKPPMLLGEMTAKAILSNRVRFRDQLAKVNLTGELRARWKAVRRPFTLVAVFGSWCKDSNRQVPDLMALDAEPNPFIEVHYIGVARDMAVVSWPKGCPPQRVVRVPTFYLFATKPGGGQVLVGKVVERPTRSGQTMAETLVELVDTNSRAKSFATTM
jgi:hypothetical protein